jgi:hypothetical protein
LTGIRIKILNTTEQKKKKKKHIEKKGTKRLSIPSKSALFCSLQHQRKRPDIAV